MQVRGITGLINAWPGPGRTNSSKAFGEPDSPSESKRFGIGQIGSTIFETLMGGTAKLLWCGTKVVGTY